MSIRKGNPEVARAVHSFHPSSFQHRVGGSWKRVAPDPEVTEQCRMPLYLRLSRTATCRYSAKISRHTANWTLPSPMRFCKVGRSRVPDISTFVSRTILIAASVRGDGSRYPGTCQSGSGQGLPLRLPDEAVEVAHGGRPDHLRMSNVLLAQNNGLGA